MEKNYYTDFSCCGYNEKEHDYLEYVSDTEYTEIIREENLERKLMTN